MERNKAKVLIGLPTADSKSFNMMMLSLIYQLEGFPVEFVTVERQRISSARNKICQYMLGKLCRKCGHPLKEAFSTCECGHYNEPREYTHLLFMDSDNTVSYRTLGKFIEMDKDIVSAVIKQRGEDDTVCVMKKHKLDDDNWQYVKYKASEILKPEVFEIDACGMGFCLIKKEVVEKVCSVYGNPFIELCHKRQNGDFIELTEIGEDLSFCIKAARLGFQMYADPTITTEHLDLPKKMIFTGLTAS